jgi:hypothetical protein
VLERLRGIKNPAVTQQGIELAAEFASRAGGIAELQRLSGASVYARPAAAD